MQLSAELFQEIVTSLRSTPASGRECRKMPRVGVRGRSLIALPARTGPRTYAVSVRDVSSTGIGLLLQEPLLAIDDDFVLVLPSRGQQPMRQMLCKVIRCQQLSQRLFAIGATFQKELSGSGDATARAAKHSTAVSPRTRASFEQADSAAVNGVEERLKRLSA